ncbi:MAG: exodeoxyribonuclease V subunit beta [Desulforhopalus sp.]|nr:exodeoxyribonuclease V subunit beta [Desulforhopalus sp.]
MAAEFEIFDVGKCHLTKGITLVEASAGTGKTYAIAMLVLRVVVEQAVPIDRILIVTFTKAATEELRLRIRTRLVEARNAFAGNGAGADPTLASWAESIGDKDAALNRLQLALADIDLAGIFTIHGFCQRMLVEQALESGQLFDVELLTDIDGVRMQIAEDFWRSRVYQLPPLACGLLTKAFPGPEHLLASVGLARREDCRIEPVCGPLEGVLARLDGCMARLYTWWQGSCDLLLLFYQKAIAGGLFKKDFTEDFDRWWLDLDDFFTGKIATLPEKIGLLTRQELAGQLDGNKVRGEAKKRACLADWPLPEADVADLLAAAADLLRTLRVELAEKLRAEVTRRLEKQGNMGFDDLIARLYRALQGESGQALQSQIGSRYAVALIDEFQDTDGAQWHIFSSIFGRGGHALYLIGDPKQAIYKFRGADIHSYFLARSSAKRLLTLEKNYRSHPFLIGEVNRLFTSRPQAFYFSPEVLDYRPVVAAKKPSDIDLLQDGRSLAGMVYCLLAEDEKTVGGRHASTRAGERLLRFTVAEICSLLDPTRPSLVRTDQDLPLAPRDIAILVRSHRQAEAYQRALAEVGIPAVVNSRQSVFHTDECRDLILLLQAIAAPGDTAKLGAALTLTWFGLSGNDLYQLFGDEARCNLYHGRFLDYHQCWREQGLLAMMNRLLTVEGVLVTLAGDRFAERAIANINQLLELVQEEESAENLGMGQVCQWLLVMHGNDRNTENTELLLESDEEAVRIVTMHGAKGLEYPVVFCPYLWYRSNRLGGEKHQVTGHDENSHLVVDLGSEKFQVRLKAAMDEQMAEDLRLLYVALTRAKIRCYTMWADVKGHSTVADSFQSALGYLLFPDGVLPYHEQEARLQALAELGTAQMMIVTGDEIPVARAARANLPELRPLYSSGRSLYTDWQMSSYSAMAMLSEYGESGENISSISGRIVPVPGLPAGASFGNVVHELLDGLSFAAIARMDRENDQLVRQKCRRYGITADPAEVVRLLQQVVMTPLLKGAGPENFRLAGVDTGRCLKEMAFYFHLGLLETKRINAILEGEPTFVPLGQRVMRGYLTGFIDLFFESGGKFYVLDYKTNFLGDSLADYGAEKLVSAMQSHNYGLQYWLYTLVLHRHLQQHLPGYSYQDHFGGALYLFVRGMTPDIAGSGVYASLPSFEKVMALDQAMGGGDNE